MKISASLVLYHNEPHIFGPAIDSFLKGSDGVLLVVDNSAAPLSHELFAHPQVEYLFVGRNVGFGAGHNIALKRLAGRSSLHLFLNPDVVFDPDVLAVLERRMSKCPDIGALMPRIQFPDGTPQRLCKLLPTPLDLLVRRFVPFAWIRQKMNERYELQAMRDDTLMDVPSLSGCFLLVRTDLLDRIGGFDERYFMYMEDVDLVRRIGDFARTVYDPSASVTHAYAKGSYRNKKLLTLHMTSALSYFRKWGWAFDPTRSKRNRAILNSIRRDQK